MGLAGSYGNDGKDDDDDDDDVLATGGCGCVCVSAFLWERREKLDMTSFYPFSPLWCTENVLQVLL